MRHIPADLIEHTLRGHWITSVNCDKDARTNYASCSCSAWRGPTRPSVGEAVNDWIAHVMADGLDVPPLNQQQPPEKSSG